MERLFWICIAGALGTGTRHLVGIWAEQRFGTGFPYGTLIVNVTGCFLIAAVMHVGLHTAALSPNLRLALTTGFLGGLTTYSSFNYETTMLLKAGAVRMALLNFGVTAVLCFVAGLLGLALAQRLTGS